MKPNLIVLNLVAVFVCGCTTANFLAYTGEQPDWPTAQGSLMEEVDGIPVYHGLPPKPYEVLGQVELAQRHQLAPSVISKAATVAKEKGASAVIVLEQGRDLLAYASSGGGNANTSFSANTYSSGRYAQTTGTADTTWSSWGASRPIYGGTARVVLIRFK